MQIQCSVSQRMRDGCAKCEDFGLGKTYEWKGTRGLDQRSISWGDLCLADASFSLGSMPVQTRSGGKQLKRVEYVVTIKVGRLSALQSSVYCCKPTTTECLQSFEKHVCSQIFTGG